MLSGTLTKDGNRFKVADEGGGSGERQGDRRRNRNSVEQGRRAGRGRRASPATSAQALGDNRFGHRATVCEGHAVGHVARCGALVCQGHGSAVAQPVQRRAAGLLRDGRQDPKFGLAYAGMAIASSNMGRQQDAEKYVKEAIGLVDGMTERERYRTRGMFYFITNDYQPCVKEYGDLIAKYSADAAARNNRALCLSKLRDMKKAVDEMRQVVKILPNRALYRVNLATYAAYNGDGATAEQESRNAMDQSPWALQSLALAQTLQNQIAAGGADLPRHGQVRAARAVLHRVWPGRPGAVRRPVRRRGSDLHRGRRRRHRRERDGSRRRQAGRAGLHGTAPRTGSRRRSPPPRKRWRPARRGPFASSRRASWSKPVQPQRAKRIAVTLGNDLQPEAQALASIIDGMIALGRRRQSQRRPLPERSEHPARHLDRALRAGPRLPARERVPAGGLGIRSLRHPPRRGAVAVPGRRAHLRLLPVACTTTRARCVKG